MTVGQEFHAFAAGLESEIQLLKDSEKYLYDVNMGATAIGSGSTCRRDTPKSARRISQRLSANRSSVGRHVPGDVGSTGVRRLLLRDEKPGRELAKISSDLILLTSGPRAGLAEINLPALQPGSSIMPGKSQSGDAGTHGDRRVPVMETTTAWTLAAHSGQLQLNATNPLRTRHH